MSTEHDLLLCRGRLQTLEHTIQKMEQEAHRLRIHANALQGQRNRSRALCEQLAPALRRCVDDSKDRLSGAEIDKIWVATNIEAAEKALDLWEERDWT